VVSEAAAASIATAGSETVMEGKTVMPPSTKLVVHGKPALMPAMHGSGYCTQKE
jgi:hypothetical protein